MPFLKISKNSQKSQNSNFKILVHHFYSMRNACRGGSISRRPGVESADRAGRHLWLRAGVGSADRAVVIYAYKGRWEMQVAALLKAVRWGMHLSSP